MQYFVTAACQEPKKHGRRKGPFAVGRRRWWKKSRRNRHLFSSGHFLFSLGKDKHDKFHYSFENENLNCRYE